MDSLKSHKLLGILTLKMGRLWEALIQLANVQEKGMSSSSVLIPNSADIKKISGLEIVPVPTASIAVVPSTDYGDIVGW